MADATLVKAKGKPRGRSFRGQLTIAGIILVGLVGVPLLAVEAPRPWESLRAMVNQAHGVLAGTWSGFVPEELDQLNRFALDIADRADKADESYLVWTFNLLVMEGGLPGEAEFKAALDENEVEVEAFDYAKVQAAYRFWEDEFALAPGLLELFRKYKHLIIQAKEAANRAGFGLEDLYVMVDNRAVFAFVIDGFPWYESSYPGLKYDVEVNGDQYWRRHWQDGPGYYCNPIFHTLGVFPKFDTDQWGTWFTVWMSAPRPGDVFNAFSIDFDAGAIRRQMWRVGASVIAGAALVLLLVVLVSLRLSRLLAEPIREIEAGAEAVMREDFDHVAPPAKVLEFQGVIEMINRMIRRLKEIRELEFSYQQLQKLDEIKDNFLSMVSHDLRTPMTSIKGYATILAEEAGEIAIEEQKQYLEIIITESDRLTRLINDLLDLQRLDAGRMKLHFLPTDLNHLARQAVDTFDGAGRAKNIKLELHAPTDAATLIADPDRISQVIANFLSNAIKFTPEGGRVEVVIEKGEQTVRLTVRDTGPGIPLDQQEQLFSRFQYIESLDRSKEQGSGLGLALAREIVERHRGRIGMESVPGQGSSFYFILRTNPEMGEADAEKSPDRG